MGKALDKFAYAVTKAGHKYDAAENKASADRIQSRLDNEAAYAEKKPLAGYLTGNDPSTKFVNEVSRNRALYLTNKHKKSENSYNPFAGWSDKEKRKADKKAGLAGKK